MNIGEAVEALKQGHGLAREGWNGKSQYIQLQPGEVMYPGTPDELIIGAYIEIFTEQGVAQPGWLASQADLLADDWYIKHELKR